MSDDDTHRIWILEYALRNVQTAIEHRCDLYGIERCGEPYDEFALSLKVGELMRAMERKIIILEDEIEGWKVLGTQGEGI